MIFSDESLFFLFPTTGFSQLLKMAEVLGRYFLEIRRANDFLHGRINKRNYLQILSDQVHSMVQALFPVQNVIFQDDNAPARIVKE